MSDANLQRITPPYGFREIVPLDKAHQVLLARGGVVADAFRTMSAVPVCYGEFPAAIRDYPLVFFPAAEEGRFLPMLVVGLAAHQNLFVMWDGSWDRRAYVPAYVRRYPFCIASLNAGHGQVGRQLVCVEKGAISEQGQALFDADGRPLASWEERRRLLSEFEDDVVRTEEMCALLVRHGLLEACTVQVAPVEGRSFQLNGMFRVAEERLAALSGAVYRELATTGVLARIYAHLISLNNFQHLLKRRAAFARRSAGGQGG